MMKRVCLVLALVLVVGGFNLGFAQQSGYIEPTSANYRKIVDGKQVDLYTIKNGKGMVVKITNYGAKIEQIMVRDRNGTFADVVQGYESIDKALGGQGSMGAFVGRYANRIGGAKFTLDGKEYQLAKNNGENTLHGGEKGSRFCVYDAHQINDSSVEMFYTYKDGEENFPGTLATRVCYGVTKDNALVVDYQAYSVDKNTVANFTTHSFFNLSGNLGSEILDHVIFVNASRFLPINSGLIPTGELAPVENTPMDFRVPTPFGARIKSDFEQLKLAGGYDHHWVLDKKTPNELSRAAMCVGAQVRSVHGSLYDRTGLAGPHRKQPRGKGPPRCREGLDIHFPLGLQHGAFPVPRFSEQAGFPHDGDQGRRVVFRKNGIQVLSEVSIVRERSIRLYLQSCQGTVQFH